MASQDVVVLNDLGLSSLSRRTRTTSSGSKNRYSIEFRAEPILHDFSIQALGQGPAEAIRDLLTQRIKAIGQVASPSTILARKSAETALAAGKSWATRRYAGGRTGRKNPGQSDRLFNDSGRLAEGLEVRENRTDGNYTINVPANRLDPSTFKGGEAALVSMFQRLVTLVPEFRGGREITKHAEIREAIAEAVTDSIVVGNNRARSSLSRARLRAYTQALRDFESFLQIGA